MKHVLRACATGAVLAIVAIPAIRASAGTIDAVSGASISVTGGTTTDSSATIRWSEVENDGTLRIFWDTTATVRNQMHDSVTVPNGSGTRGSNARYTIPIPPDRLLPGRTYHYIIRATRLSDFYQVAGTFTTDRLSTAVAPRPVRPAAARGPLFDVLGRRIGETPASGIGTAADHAPVNLAH